MVLKGGVRDRRLSGGLGRSQLRSSRDLKLGDGRCEPPVPVPAAGRLDSLEMILPGQTFLTVHHPGF